MSTVSLGCGKCLPFPTKKDQQKAENAKKCAEKCVRNMILRIESKDISLNSTLNEYFGVSISDPSLEHIKSNYDDILKAIKNPVCYDPTLSKSGNVAQTNPVCPQINLGDDFLYYKNDEEGSETVIHESAHYGLSQISYNPFSNFDDFLRKAPFKGELSSDEYETYIKKKANGDKEVWAKNIKTGLIVNKGLLSSLSPADRRKLPDSYSNAVMDNCNCKQKAITGETSSEQFEEMIDSVDYSSALIIW